MGRTVLEGNESADGEYGVRVGRNMTPGPPPSLGFCGS